MEWSVEHLLGVRAVDHVDFVPDFSLSWTYASLYIHHSTGKCRTIGCLWDNVCRCTEDNVRDAGLFYRKVQNSNLKPAKKCRTPQSPCLTSSQGQMTSSMIKKATVRRLRGFSGTISAMQLSMYASYLRFLLSFRPSNQAILRFSGLSHLSIQQ